MTDRDYIIEVNQELHHIYVSTGKTTTYKVSESDILYYKHRFFSVTECVRDLLN